MKTTLHEQIHEVLKAHGPIENRDQLLQDLMALIPQVDGGRALTYPHEMDGQLFTVLGLQDYQITPMVDLFRAVGHDIPLGGEQAFVLHRMILLVLEHGIKWQAAWGAMTQLVGNTRN